MVKTYSCAKDGAVQLSPHFRVREFRCQDGTDKILIDGGLVALLEKLRNALEDRGYEVTAIYVNSGYRTPAHDKAVGGNGRGQHTLGKAADINVRVSCPGDHVEQRGDKYYLTAAYLCCVLQDLDAHGIGYMGGIAVHCDCREGRWWGDETTGDNVRDWYAYFEIDRPDDPAEDQTGPDPEIVWDYAVDVEIRELQKILNAKGFDLAVDGKAGDDTYAAVRRYTVRKGDRGPLTQWVQERLNDLGYGCGAADGIAGSNTMAGIAAFQRAHGLGVGYLGGSDWYYLLR